MHSEHTINGRYFDFEMHIVDRLNVEDQNFIGGVIGILFDRYNYDKSVTQEQEAAIDAFFDSLELGEIGEKSTEEKNPNDWSWNPKSNIALENMMKASYEELLEVDNIGPKTAAKIREIIGSEYKR